jgi:hypothetical protein
MARREWREEGQRQMQRQMQVERKHKVNTHNKKQGTHIVHPRMHIFLLIIGLTTYFLALALALF